MTASGAQQTPIVLVHGWAGSSAVWEPVVEALRAAGHRGEIVAVDLPGSPRATPGGEPTIAGAATVVVEAMTSLARPALIVGHSMGGQITLLAHAARGDLVAGEVVIDPAYGAADDEEPRHRLVAEQIEREGSAALTSFFASGFGTLGSDVRSSILIDLHGTTAETLASYLRSEYLDPDAIGFAPATVPAARRRTRPVFALHSSPRGEAAERVLPAPAGSRVHRWDGHGHFLHLEDPTRFADEMTAWANGMWN